MQTADLMQAQLVYHTVAAPARSPVSLGVFPLVWTAAIADSLQWKIKRTEPVTAITQRALRLGMHALTGFIYTLFTFISYLIHAYLRFTSYLLFDMLTIKSLTFHFSFY